MNEFQKMLMQNNEDEQYLTVDPSLKPKAFAPMLPEELAQASTVPASPSSVILNTLTPPVDTRPVEKTVEGLMGQYIGAPRSINVPQVDLSKYDTQVDKARQEEFQTSLDELKETYNANRADTSKRQMYAEMLAALGNNIGTAVAGAQAMNTKASVNPVKTAPINVKDMVAGVDKQFRGDYDGLLKQYKDLQNGQLSMKDRAYLDMGNKQMQMQGIRAEANSENQYYGRGLRVGQAGYKEQEGNELSDKQLDLFRTADNVLAEFGRVRELKKGVNTGPIQKLRNQGAAMLGIDDPNVTALRAKTLNALSEKIKALSGAAASDSEVGRLQVTLPEIGQDDDVFDRLLQEAEDQITRAIESDKKNIKRYQAKNVYGYKGEGSPAPAYDAFEAKMQKAMAANPNATRAQIEAALKNRR